MKREPRPIIDGRCNGSIRVNGRTGPQVCAPFVTRFAERNRTQLELEQSDTAWAQRNQLALALLLLELQRKETIRAGKFAQVRSGTASNHCTCMAAWARARTVK
jgi:hypothetical protein